MLVISDLNRHLPRQRGFTLIELMVGILVGSIVLSAALAIYLMGVRGSTHAVRAAKLNQEMRTGMTLMVDDIRRAGYWGDFQQDTPNSFTVRAAVPDNSTDIYILNDGTCILYSYDATYNPGTNFFGFRLADGALEMRHGGNTTNNCADGNWQPITDPNTILITTLTFDMVGSQCLNSTAAVDLSTGQSFLPNWVILASSLVTTTTTPACQNTTANNYVAPNSNDRLIELRQINIRMVARHVNDAQMRATLEQSVKVRNDRVFTF